MCEDLASDFAKHPSNATFATAANGHEGRCQSKMHGIVKTEHQRHRNASLRTKSGDSQGWSHVTNVAIGSGKSLNRGHANIGTPGESGDEKTQDENKQRA